MTTADGSRTADAGRTRSWLHGFDSALLTLCLGSILVVVAGALIQVSFGSYSMSAVRAWQAVFDPGIVLDPNVWAAFVTGGTLPEMTHESLIIWSIRLPRVFVAVLVGMNLAVSGAIFQAVTRNELASPFILGVSSGAGLAILLTLVVFSGLSAFLPLIAAVGGAGAFLLVYAVAWKSGTSPVRLVLAGVIVGTVFQSLQTGLFFFAGDIRVS